MIFPTLAEIWAWRSSYNSKKEGFLSENAESVISFEDIAAILRLSLTFAFFKCGLIDFLHEVNPYSYISAKLLFISLVQMISNPADSNPKSRKPPPVKKKEEVYSFFLTLLGSRVLIHNHAISSLSLIA